MFIIIYRQIINLFLRNFDLPVVDPGLDVARALAVDGAPDGVARSQDLLDGSRELLRHGPFPHLPRDVDDLIEGDVAVVDDVLHLLAIAIGLVQRLHDEGGGGRDHRDGGLTVHDRETTGMMRIQKLTITEIGGALRSRRTTPTLSI